jgi:protoheme IX farnesyltransferase
MVGASNAYNQVIEKDLGYFNGSYQNRPVPAGRMSPRTAMIVATILTSWNLYCI